MIKLQKPDLDVKKIIEDCLINTRKEPTLSHVNSSKQTIVTESNKYDVLAQKGQLNIVKSHKSIMGGATKEDMIWLYDNKFVSDGGRKYYDIIKAIPKYGKCPFCGVGRVSTLDHYLPKTKYPTYAVTPFNLVASCLDCNKNKTSDVPKSREKEFIHPYYDDFDDEIWLKVKILFNEEIVFKFYVEKPNNWSNEKYERAKYHLSKLKLNELYISHCGEEFTEYEDSARRLYSKGGVELVKSDLQDRIRERRSVTKNNWRAALYEGLLECGDFFDKFLAN